MRRPVISFGTIRTQMSRSTAPHDRSVEASTAAASVASTSCVVPLTRTLQPFSSNRIPIVDLERDGLLHHGGIGFLAERGAKDDRRVRRSGSRPEG